MVTFTISQMEAGKKVHRLIRQLLPGVPLSGIYKMLRTGRVKCNGKKVKAEDTLQLGDVIQIYIASDDYERVRKSEKKFSGVPKDIAMVFENEEMLIVNKPAGLLTHGAGEEHKDTLVNRVLAYLYEKDELNQRIFTPSPVNRLDRNTSGLVVFGKTAEATRRLAEDIAQHRIRKWYLAIVEGQPPQQGVIDAPLMRDQHANQSAVHRRGKTAVTRYQVQATHGSTSVVKIELVSGRTHQIRAHFQHIGHPLWGDIKYGGRFDRKTQSAQSRNGSVVSSGWARYARKHQAGGLERTQSVPTASNPSNSHQWLHAAWLEMADGSRFFAPLPAPFVQALRRLGYRETEIDRIQQF